jgi:hypothetical protein
MTLNVGENSYVSVADADTYFTDRNNSSWAASDTATKEAALIEATQYLDASYRWRGTVASSGQALGWPRTGASDREGRTLSSALVPAAIEDAAFELASARLSNPLLPPQPRGGRTSKEKVGPLEVTYHPGAPGEMTYNLVERILVGLHNGRVAGISTNLVRA